MGKIIRLNNGTEYSATVTSTATSWNIPVQNYAEIDGIKATLTPENLGHVTFDGVGFDDMELIAESASRTGGVIVAVFGIKLGLEDRIEAERQAAIDEYTLQLIEEGVL